MLADRDELRRADNSEALPMSAEEPGPPSTAPQLDHAVRLTDVSVRRGDRSVLRSLSLTVPRGKVTGLVGPSGCGKTTLMRTIVGVQANVTGSVLVLGQSPESAARRGDIGYMTQDASVYGDLTVGENLSYFAALLGCSAARMSEVLVAVHLEDMRDAVVERLSGGQRARVSLAVALLANPPLLVLDEPTVGLDPLLRAELWAEFATIAASGAAVVVSSHVMDEAARCDRLVLMREGRILASGTPAGLVSEAGASDVEDAFMKLVARQSEDR
ncbi:MAG: ABC transporter ATP-binding protein [Acidimicrobiales bacterium]|nr:ABC transporter ATP-binding protein [Acidimicrobiales bacterium]